MKQIWRVLAGMVLCGLFAGCAREPAGEQVTVATLASHLSDPLWLARLDQPGTILHSSYDRTGANNDYGAFLRDSRTPGWKVLADLKGPGYVSRFWFTGAVAGLPHRFRFYFDGEDTPRLEGNIRALFGGRQAPFLAPLAEYNNYCWYSFVPLPYAESLRIECEIGPPGAKVYYQISESPLPRRTPVETFSLPLAEENARALETARSVWQADVLPEAGTVRETILDRWSQPVMIEGPGILRRIEFKPDWDALPAEERDAALRDWVVAIRFDGAEAESVEVPLGDLCGMPWRRIRAHSLYFGMEDQTLFCAFPMPFARTAEIRLKAGRIPSVPVTVRCRVERMPDSPIGEMGYFHAGWWRSTPREAGRPHPVARLKGSGKYVGCLLAVCSLDQSFWALEGDETIRKDDEKSPGWKGTGLEDYFNGGWYYQNVMAGPTHGLFLKEFFRAVQYRVHAMDPTVFSESLDMDFERGPDQTSKAYFESVYWAYLAAPQDAGSLRLRSADRGVPRDARIDPVTTMPALWNHERFDDLQGEKDELEMRLRLYGKTLPPAAVRMLEFRLALLEEALGGEDPLDRFAADPESSVREAAALLRRERETGDALAVLYANMPARLYVDGREVLQAGRPERASAVLLPLSPGPHTFAILASRKRYPDWVQLSVRGPDWFAGTDPTWKYALDPEGDWTRPDYDDSDWPMLNGPGDKGPPEEPYIWVEPDPFLNMQSKALGVRLPRDWPDQARMIGYRKTVVVPD